MASIIKTSKGYRVQVYVKGERDSETFDTQREAKDWANRRETELREAIKGKSSTIITTHDAFKKYSEEVAPKHKGCRWEVVRLNKFQKDFPRITMDKLNSDHVIRWRDERLGKIGESSVLREMKLLNSVFKKCMSREWKYLNANPCVGIEKPKASPHRQRTISLSEIRIMLRALGYPDRTLPRHATAYAFLLALRTGMRQGELAAITWDKVMPNYIVVSGKTMEKEYIREVPLSRQAKRLVAKIRGYHPESMFNMKGSNIDVHFRRAREERTDLEGFTFHDSRHTAATWIGRSGKLQLMELCKMFGWKDPKNAMIYFNPTGDDLSRKL